MDTFVSLTLVFGCVGCETETDSIEILSNKQAAETTVVRQLRKKGGCMSIGCKEVYVGFTSSEIVEVFGECLFVKC